MNKLAFVFSGQGAQKIGMGKELALQYPCAMKVFDSANEALGFDLKDMVWNGDSDTLMITENTQPAILTMSVAALSILQEKGIRPDVVAGLSLGEYSAHVASGSLTFEDAVKLVRKRGKYMQETVPLGVGGMAAILGLENSVVEECCRQAASSGYVAPTNYNCPGQLVIAGEAAAVEHACQLCKEKGAKRAKMLPVSAPFHCKLLEPAGIKLKEEMEHITFHPMAIPLITNLTGDYVKESDSIKEVLVAQVSNPVRWEDSIRRMIADGVDTFVEIGPGKALCGFIGRISKEAKALNIEDPASLEATLAALGTK